MKTPPTVTADDERPAGQPMFEVAVLRIERGS
jgi:hypothetical protein